MNLKLAAVAGTVTPLLCGVAISAITEKLLDNPEASPEAKMLKGGVVGILGLGGIAATSIVRDVIIDLAAKA